MKERPSCDERPVVELQKANGFLQTLLLIRPIQAAGVNSMTRVRLADKRVEDP